MAKKWTTEVCGPVAGPVLSSNDFGVQRLLEENLVLLQPQIYGVKFFGRRAGRLEASAFGCRPP